MLKDFEGLSRAIIGFSKNPEIDGEGMKIDYSLKPLDINWLRKIFNVDPNNNYVLARSMEEQDYKLDKVHYDMLKPYIIGTPVDFDEYIFFLNTTGASFKKWDWRSGHPIQIKNVDTKIGSYYTNKVFDPILNDYILESSQETLALKLDLKYWEEFYDYIRNNYPFTELSIYRIDWESVKNYQVIPWNQAINSPATVKKFLENTCLNQFEEVIIAYGPREPVILISLKYIYDYPLDNLFDEEWGACFIIGAKRDKYGIVRLIKECFVEVDCGDCLTILEI